MERRKSENITDVLLRFLREEGLETPLAEHRAVEAWPEVAGALVAKHTTDIYIRSQTLYVRVDLPAMRANLMMEKSRLVEMINRRVGMRIIYHLVCM